MTQRESLTPTDVRRLLDTGADPTTIAVQLVASGVWSTNGADEIIRFLTAGPDALLARQLPALDRRLERHARRALAQ